MALLLNPFRFGAPAWTPADLTGVSNWWDADDPATITEVSGEVTAWDDKVGTADLAKDVNGPAQLTVSGVNTMDFDASNSERMKVTSAEMDPAGGDWFQIVVFRSNSNATQGLCGKFGSGDPHYGSFLSVGANGSSYFQFREVLASTWILDDTATDWTDNAFHVQMMTYKDSEADLFMYVDDLTIGNDVAQNLVAVTGTISPSNPFYVSTWNGSTDFMDGQIAEIIIGQAVPDGSERSNLSTYLNNKYGI